ncbi:MAG: hypothetical protein RLZZ546_1082 [Bacteroidota bacterium]|jgi:hypothetical protein
MLKHRDSIKIKSSVKEELISRYETSGGMSGLSKDDVDKKYIYRGMDGSNIIAEYELDESVIISLNHSRFEKCEDIKPKEHIMSKKQRKNIFRAAKKLIKSDVKDFDSLPQGKQESVQDTYIEKVCIENGWTLSDFYFTDSKELLNLF